MVGRAVRPDVVFCDVYKHVITSLKFYCRFAGEALRCLTAPLCIAVLPVTGRSETAAARRRLPGLGVRVLLPRDWSVRLTPKKKRGGAPSFKFNRNTPPSSFTRPAGPKPLPFFASTAKPDLLLPPPAGREGQCVFCRRFTAFYMGQRPSSPVSISAAAIRMWAYRFVPSEGRLTLRFKRTKRAKPRPFSQFP